MSGIDENLSQSAVILIGIWPVPSELSEIPNEICQISDRFGEILEALSRKRPVSRRLVELLPDGRQFAGQTTRVAKPELSGMSRLRDGQSFDDKTQ
jgi:hypothetical protein